MADRGGVNGLMRVVLLAVLIVIITTLVASQL
jgi:hypothetical protein